MDQVKSQQFNQPDNQRKTKIFLVLAIIIASIIVALLYFDVIPSKPRQNNKPVAIATPSPTAEFKYDTAKAKKLVTQYIKDTIKPFLLPATIEVRQGLTIGGRTENAKDEYGFYLADPDATISANFHYRQNSNTPNDYVIYIMSNTNDAIATAPLANSLLSSYLTTPYVITDCKTKGSLSFCENFQTVANGKKGYGILIGNDSGNTINITFTCFIPKESKDYGLKSCLSQ